MLNLKGENWFGKVQMFEAAIPGLLNRSRFFHITKLFLSREIIPTVFPTLENEVCYFDNNSSFQFTEIFDFQETFKVLCLM